MDYEKELYKPLLDSKIGKENNFILPHSEEYNDVDTKQILINSDLLIAEVSIGVLFLTLIHNNLFQKFYILHLLI